jgi:hypothetical protein
MPFFYPNLSVLAMDLRSFRLWPIRRLGFVQRSAGDGLEQA